MKCIKNTIFSLKNKALWFDCNTYEKNVKPLAYIPPIQTPHLKVPQTYHILKQVIQNFGAQEEQKIRGGGGGRRGRRIRGGARGRSIRGGARGRRRKGARGWL